MARRNITHVRKVPDPAIGYNYFMRMASMPGNPGFNVDDFGVRVQTAEVPEETNEHYEVFFFGIPRKFVGRKAHSQTFALEAVEIRNYDTWKSFYRWSRYTMDNSNRGTYHDEHVTDVYLEGFAQKGEELQINVVLKDCSLETFGGIQWDSSAADAVRVPATLSFFVMDLVDGQGNPIVVPQN